LELSGYHYQLFALFMNVCASFRQLIELLCIVQLDHIIVPMTETTLSSAHLLPTKGMNGNHLYSERPLA
jgi:hypothetical protein